MATVGGRVALALIVWTGGLTALAVGVTRVPQVELAVRPAALAAAGVGLGVPVVFALALPALGRRGTAPVTEADLDADVDGEAVRRTVGRLADAAGTETPAVRVTDAAVPQVVPLPGTVGPPTLLVSGPALAMAEDRREALLAHGVVRLGSGTALATAALYGAVAIPAQVSRWAARAIRHVEGRGRAGDEPGEAGPGVNKPGLHASPDGIDYGQRGDLVGFLMLLPAILAIVLVGPLAVLTRHAMGLVSRPSQRAADRTAADLAAPDALAGALRTVDTKIEDARDRGEVDPPLDALSAHPADDYLVGEGLRAGMTGTTHPALSERVEWLEDASATTGSRGVEW